MWYKKIYKFLCLYLVSYPIFWFYFFGNLCENNEENCTDNNFIPMFKFFLITYILGCIIILGIAWIYTLFLLWNKISYKIQQYIKEFRKKFKIKKKKIWKHSIIIQYTPPKWLTPMEVSYLYNLKHFKWNISCLFYKWAIEKRISMKFKEWTFPSFDTVEIKIINNSLDDMSEDEQSQRNLIFEKKKEIVLPNTDILKKIPIINLETAKSCLDKKLIKNTFSISLTSKLIEWGFMICCILRFPSVLLMTHIQKQMQGRLPDLLLIWWVGLIVVILFLLIILKSIFKDTKLKYYNLTEQWKKTLAEIYGYKYFLEACDEKKIKTFLEQDPNYIDKTMPYAIAIWVETEIIKSISPEILDWMNNNRYLWDLSSTAKTIITSSERTILISKEKEANKNTKVK